MFFAPDMLSKRGPLAKVWLAAHVEKKVSKNQTLATSIPSTVTVILDPGSTVTQSDGSAPPLALRLSGQLLLGITRIYGKQAKYLLEDCSEASEKIRAAFRAALTTDLGVTSNRNGIDLLPEHVGDGQNAINLRTGNRHAFDFELEFGGEFDGFGDAWEADQFLDPEATRARARTTANVADITLPEYDNMGGEGFGGLGDDDMDLDLGLGGSSNRFAGDAGLDLGLELDLDLDQPQDTDRRNRGTKRRATDDDDEEELGDRTIETEFGRDAPGTVDRRSARDSIGLDQHDVHMSDKSIEHAGSATGGDITMDVDPGFEPTGFGNNADDLTGNGFDLDLDLGLDGQDGAVQPDQQGDRTPQANRSRQQTPVPNPQTDDQNPLLGSIDVTPRTSHRLAQLKSPVRPKGAADDAETGGSAVKKPPTKKLKTQLVDAVTELEGNVGGRGGGVGSQGGSQNLGAGALTRAEKIAAGLYVEPTYLPKNRYELAYLEIRLNPRRNRCLPKTVTEDGTQWLLAAPPGVCAELTNLFKFPAPAANAPLRPPRTRILAVEGEAGPEAQEPGRERSRSRSVESELGRRQANAARQSSAFDDRMLDATFDGAGDDPGMMMGLGDGPILEQDDFRFEMQSNPDRGQDEEEVEPVAPRSVSRAPTDVPPPPRPARAEGEFSLLDIFDDISEPQPTQSSVRETATQDGGATTKWSKNTVKALKVLKDQMRPEVEDEDLTKEVTGKKINFEKVSEKATRRAASSFFFELLVLATRDCLKLEQNQAYGPIVVEEQDRLWEVMEQESL